MSKRIKEEDIKVVIANPERLPEISERLTKMLYEMYIEAKAKEKFESMNQNIESK